MADLAVDQFNAIIGSCRRSINADAVAREMMDRLLAMADRGESLTEAYANLRRQLTERLLETGESLHV